MRDPKIKDMEPVALFAPAIDLDDLGSIKEDLLAAIGEGEGDDARHDDARHDDARDGDDGAPADDAQGGDETDAGASGGDADQAGQADADRAAERA